MAMHSEYQEMAPGNFLSRAHPATGSVTFEPEKKAGDPRFHELLTKIGNLHNLKSQDYGSDHDPYANVRASLECGVAPWVGALIRLNDKVHRLQQFAQKGTLANESAEDSFLDIMVYAGIALILYREESDAEG